MAIPKEAFEIIQDNSDDADIIVGALRLAGYTIVPDEMEKNVLKLHISHQTVEEREIWAERVRELESENEWLRTALEAAEVSTSK